MRPWNRIKRALGNTMVWYKSTGGVSVLSVASWRLSHGEGTRYTDGLWNTGISEES